MTFRSKNTKTCSQVNLHLKLELYGSFEVVYVWPTTQNCIFQTSNIVSNIYSKRNNLRLTSADIQHYHPCFRTDHLIPTCLNLYCSPHPCPIYLSASSPQNPRRTQKLWWNLFWKAVKVYTVTCSFNKLFSTYLQQICTSTQL